METLASLIERDGGLQEADAVGWAIRLARSVEYVHARGHVHGRLSAAGVLVEGAECTLEGELVALADLPENVAYHSPERELGEGGSQADDTWAVAVVLYYALSGNLPFSAASDDEIRRKIRTVPAPPLAVFDVGDDDLQGIVDRALARTREARTPSVTVLRAELEAWQPELQLNELPPLLEPEELDDEVTVVHSGRTDEIREMLRAALGTGSNDPDGPTVKYSPRKKDRATPTPVPVEPKRDSAKERASRPPEALPGLVDEVSHADESDPFAVPASRAEVRTTSTRASMPPPAPTKATEEKPASGRKPRPPSEATVTDRAEEPPSKTGPIVLVVVILVAIAAAAYFMSQSSSAGATGSVTPPASAEPTGAVTASAPPPPIPTVERVTTANSAKPAAPPQDLGACIRSLFPPESFDAQTSFAPVCAETDAGKIGSILRTELVRSRKNISEGMRDWALLGWYELPTVAMTRSRCCPTPKPLDLPSVGSCSSMSEVLDGLGRAAGATQDVADKGLQAAVTAYTNEVYCVVRNGSGQRFGHSEGPEGGQDTIFLKFLRRYVKANG